MSGDLIDAARAAGWPISDDVARETRRAAGAADQPIGKEALDAEIAAFNRRAEAAAKAAGRSVKGSNRDLEDLMQIDVIRWADSMVGQWPELAYLYHAANGGKRSKGVAGKLKAMGVRRGVLDLFLPSPRGVYHGAYWELKVTGGRILKEQAAFILFIERQGYYVKVIYDDPELVKADILKYLRRAR